MATLAQKERAYLADLFEQLGPDEPTRCEGWQTGDLLAHLLIRERRPDAATGTYVRFAKPWTDKVRADYLEHSWDELVQLYRSGPPWWSPARIDKVDAIINGGEFFIHHEDARRGRPGWEPRDLDEPTSRALASMVDSAWVRGSLRKAGVGVIAALPGGRRIRLADGEPPVTVSGGPGEVLIWSTKRPAVKLEVSGDPGQVAKLEAAGFRVAP